MSNIYQESLKQLKRCLTKMLEDCEIQDWESLSEHECHRKIVITNLQSLTPDDSEAAVALLKDVISANQATTTRHLECFGKSF